jgi:serine/threonine-protein kinase
MSRYDRAAAIMLAALDLPQDERAAFVQREAGDAALEREVLALVDAHARGADFLESPPDLRAEIESRADEMARPLVAGQTVGTYTIRSLLGRGGMGVVYLAEDSRLGRTVALKAMAPRFMYDGQWRERLRREARVAAGLSHPGIAVVYALEEIDGRLYLVSEHIQGETLRDVIRRGALPLAETLAVGRQLADAVAAAHDRGIVHRDLKPENAMRTANGAIKILDFGLAKAVTADGTMADAPAVTLAGAVFGTPAYMSPEQLRGEAAGPAADIFALGVLLAELSSGVHPFDSTQPATLAARILSAEPRLDAVPAALRPVIAGCLSKRADDRFRSAHELRAALDRVARGGTVRATRRIDAFWWWQFHQGMASAFSVSVATGVFLVWGWLPTRVATPLVVAAIVGGASATTLRLNNWFSASVLPGAGAPRGAAFAARAGDVLLSAAALAAGVWLDLPHPVASALLIASAVTMLFIGLIVEPATARAAHRQ